MKQTAVEWLEGKISGFINTMPPGNRISALKSLDKAKKLELKNINDRLDAIYEQVLQLYNNEEITGFSKRAYSQCLDIIEQFKNE